MAAHIESVFSINSVGHFFVKEVFSLLQKPISYVSESGKLKGFRES